MSINSSGRENPSTRKPEGFLASGAAVFLLSLGVYAATFSRTVQWGDSGELTAAAYVLGVPHAPGYPLLMLLAKLVSLLPVGSVAARLNFLNGLLAAAATTLISAVARRLGARHFGAALAGVALALSPVFWSQAVAFEVYSLAVLMLALLFLLALKWGESRQRGALFLLAFAFGLGTSAHLLLAAFAPAFLIFSWIVSRQRSAASTAPPVAAAHPCSLSSLALVVGALLLSAAIWLYLPLRAGADPPINFGQPSTWDNFLRVVTGGPGRARILGRGLEEIPGALAALFHLTVTAFYWPGILLAALGGCRLMMERRDAFTLTGSVLLIDLLFAANLRVWDVEVFLLPSHLVVALWVGLGADWLLATLRKSQIGPTARLALSPQRRWLSWALGAILLLLPWAQAWDNWRQMDLSNDREASYFAQNFLNSVEPDALLVTDWWYVGPLFYARFVEGKRPDVEVIPQFSKADPRQRLVLFTDQTVNTRPVYAAEFLTDCIRRLRSEFLLLPLGRIGQRAYRVLGEDAPLPPGSEHPSLQLHWEAAPGWELLGFDLPSPTVVLGGEARLVCHWRVKGGFAAPKVLLALDAAENQGRLWRERSTLLDAAAQRLRRGEHLLFREEVIAWLPSDAPPGRYQFTIQAREQSSRKAKSISPQGLSVWAIPWQNTK